MFNTLARFVVTFVLTTLAATTIFVVGYIDPILLDSAIVGADTAVRGISQNGYVRLMVGASGAGFALLVSIIMVYIGISLRELVSDRFFRWRRIGLATLLPIIAHVVMVVIVAVAPNLLWPAQQVADQMLSWFGPATQVQFGFFHARDHLMTIMVSFALLLIWVIRGLLWKISKFIARRLWRLAKKAFSPTPQPQPPAPTGKTKRRPFMGIFSRRSRVSSNNEPKAAELTHRRAGWWTGPIQSFFWFSASTLILSFWLAAVVFWEVLAPSNITYFTQNEVQYPVMGILVLIVMLLMWGRNEQRDVPNNHVVPLKFVGQLLNIHLTNGWHILPLAWLFSTNRDNVTGEAVYGSLEQNADDPGLIYTGDVTVHLGQEGGDSPKMSAVTGDKAQAFVRPTFTYRCIKPLQRLRRNRPIKDLNEAARTVVRDIFGALATSRQINELSAVIAALTDNRYASYVRTRRSAVAQGVHGGDVVATATDNTPIVFVTDHPPTPQEISDYKRDIIARGLPAMLKASTPDNGDDYTSIEISTLRVADRFIFALDENGYTMTGVPRIGEIEIPEELTKAAGKVAAEVEERKGAIATAETTVAAAEKYQEGQAGLSKENAQIVAMNREVPGTAQIIHLSGGNAGGVIVNTSKQQP